MMDTLMNLVPTTLQDITFLDTLIYVFVGLFVAVMFCKTAERWVGQWLGLSKKNKILTFLGLGIGGLLVVMEVVALSGAVNEQAKANQNTEQGHRQERLKNAVEHLGHASAPVRLGGAYELFHLAEAAIDTEDRLLCRTALDLLSAHIRMTTGEEAYQKKYRSKPSEEIQSLLALLFVRTSDLFIDMDIELQGSWLNGAELIGARLHNADLRGVRLQGANLAYAQLQGATLYFAHLQGAYLGHAQLQGARFYRSQLQGVDLHEAQLQGADLRDVHLQGANLWKTQFQGADLRGAQFQGVKSVDNFIKAFEERMNKFVGKESDLSTAIFEGGLTQKDVESIVEGLSDERATELQKSLERHIHLDESSELPKDSNAITGTYTAEEAERWIAEYRKAPSAE